MLTNSKKKFMTAGKALERLFQNNYTDSDSYSSSNDIHGSNSDISINSEYNEKVSS